jgi:hypothetical protein
MSTLIEQKTRLLPLRHLKRLLAASINTSEIDQRLRNLGEDPDNLRKELIHWMKVDKLYFLSEKSMDRRDLADFISREIPDSDKIIFPFEYESWGDGWGGDWDTMVSMKTRYMVLTIEDGEPKVIILETQSEEHYWGPFEDTFDMKLVEPDVKYSLYQMIALHPKLIERLVLIVGGYEELLKML